MTEEESVMITKMVFAVQETARPLVEVLEELEGDDGWSRDRLVKLRRYATKAGYLKTYQGSKRRWFMTEGDRDVSNLWVTEEEKRENFVLPDEGVLFPSRIPYEEFKAVNAWQKKHSMLLAYVPADSEVYVRPKGSKERPVKLKEVEL